MRRFIAGVLFAATATVMLTAANDQNTLTAAEKKDGWKLLFDGKTTTGWRGWKQQTAPDGWKAVEGALTRVDKAGDLITVDQYASFDLTFDWRIAKNGNSGVFFHVAEAPDLPNTFTTGPEYQLIDNDGHPDAKNGPDRWAAANYALHPPVNAVPKPIGEWNQSRILVNGPHVEHWLNGDEGGRVRAVERRLEGPRGEKQVQRDATLRTREDGTHRAAGPRQRGGVPERQDQGAGQSWIVSR